MVRLVKKPVTNGGYDVKLGRRILAKVRRTDTALPYSGKSYKGGEVYTMAHFQKGMPYMEKRLKNDLTRHLAERLIEEDVVEWEVHEDTSHKSSLVLKAKVNLYKAK